MAAKSEMIIFSADITPVQGWQVFWGFSKKQLDMVLHEVAAIPNDNQHEQIIGMMEWQGEAVPIISLEKYFGLSKKTASVNKYAVLKTVVEGDSGARFVRLIAQTTSNIKVRDADFSGFPASPSMIPERSDDVLGLYSMSGRQLLIIPDLTKIYHTVITG